MKSKKNKTISWSSIIWFLIILFIASNLLSLFFSAIGDEYDDANVAIIQIYGTITATNDGGGILDSGISSNTIVSLLESAENDPNVKAIVLDINSGGGSAVGSDEIGRKIKSLNKTTISWIREIGASGAYWIASSTDKIFANRMSLVGSIGVTGSYLEFAGLLDDYNITYRRLVSGKFKDSGSPFKEMTDEEEDLIQNLIDELHVIFVDEVSKNRNLSYDYVYSLATGQVYSGQKGLSLGLIDNIGGIAEITYYIENELNTTVKYKILKEKKSFTEIISRMISEQSFTIGQGIGKFLNHDTSLIKT